VSRTRGDVKIAQAGSNFLSIAPRRAFVKCQQVFKLYNAEGNMLDILFSLGQAISALLILYGGYLTIRQAMPVKQKTAVLNPALEDELHLLKHIRNDA
jgi:hypothetical protein